MNATKISLSGVRSKKMHKNIDWKALYQPKTKPIADIECDRSIVISDYVQSTFANRLIGSIAWFNIIFSILNRDDDLSSE